MDSLFSQAEREYLYPSDNLKSHSGIVCDFCEEEIPVGDDYYEVGNCTVCKHCMEECRHTAEEEDYD